MIGQRLEQLARDQPEAVALIGDPSGAGSLSTVSYAELLALGESVRLRLEAQNVRAGDVVIATLPVSPEAVATCVGCALMGTIYMPVNPSWSVPELAWLIPKVNPAAVVIQTTERTLWQDAGVPQDRLLHLDDLARCGAPPRRDAVELAPQHPAVYQLSSGSTGRPKIVVKSGQGFLESTHMLAQEVGLGPGRRVLTSSPFHFGMGFAWMLRPLLAGSTIVLMERFEPGAAAKVIQRHQVHHLWASPIVFSLLADARLPAGSLACLEFCFTGGSPISAAVQTEWTRLTGRALRQAYGTSETGIIAFQREEERREYCVGLPPQGTAIRILVGGEPQPAGVPGEIAARGPAVMNGYLDDPEATAALQQDGFLRTGDAGWMDQEGRLFLIGRIRPWINAGGVKVDPVEVQNAIYGMPGVRDCLVQAESGPRGMDVVAAVIAPEPGVTLQRADVIRYCRHHLAEYKIPRVIRFAETLVTDVTGKIRMNPAHPLT